MQIRDLIAELAAYDPTCRVETDGGHEVIGVQRGERCAELIVQDAPATQAIISDLETELHDSGRELAGAQGRVADLDKLATRLLEALQHVESCAQCNQGDWQDCDTGGKEAWQAKKDAEKELKM